MHKRQKKDEEKRPESEVVDAKLTSAEAEVHEGEAEAPTQPRRVPAHLDDMVFWATAFWQDSKPSEEDEKVDVFFLPNEGAEAIAQALHAIGHDTLTAEDIQEVYQRRS